MEVAIIIEKNELEQKTDVHRELIRLSTFTRDAGTSFVYIPMKLKVVDFLLLLRDHDITFDTQPRITDVIDRRER